MPTRALNRHASGAGRFQWNGISLSSARLDVARGLQQIGDDIAFGIARAMAL